ncbi:DMT family transporter [Brevibacterium samyangense]|uniref:DMT family transporter n=1 Tax=Brevibacterium samyangense TaxID=366888 RepID=A0ABN2TKW5_9MICO
MRDAKNYLFLVLANVFWAGNFVVGGLVAGKVDPLYLTMMRWVVATVPLFVIAVLVERPRWRSVLAEWPKLLGLSVLGLVGYGMFTYLALLHTTPVSASLLNAVCPALIAGVAVLIARERMRPVAVLGLALSLAGVVLVLVRFGGGALPSIGFGTGELLMVGAIVTWVTYTVAGRFLSSPPIAATAVQSLIASVILVPAGLLSGASAPVDAPTWWGVLFIALFPSVLSYLMWNIGVKGVGAARAGVFLNLLPFFTALAGLFLGDVLTPMQMLGGVVIVLGVVLVSRKPKTAEAPAGPPTPVAGGRTG